MKRLAGVAVATIVGLSLGGAQFGADSYALAAESPQTAKFELTVDARNFNREDSPVAVFLTLPDGFERANRVKLTDEIHHRPEPAQLGPPRLDGPQQGAHVRELDFIVHHLEAGQTVRYTAEISALPAAGTALADTAAAGTAPAGTVPADAGAFHWKDTPGNHSLLLLGDRPVIDYMYQALDDSSKASHEQTYKVFHHVFDSSGKVLLTKGPGGQDTHHRGLFYGFNKITYGEDGDKKHADTWQCLHGSYESHEGFLNVEAGPVFARHLLAIDWHGDDKDVFAHEQRELTVYNVPGGTLLDFASELITADGAVKLDGDPQHAGFHFRAPNEVATETSKETYFIRPDGVGRPGESRNWDAKGRDPRTVDLPWKGMSFVVGGKRYTAAILDLPSNPKQARFSERPYGRFGSYFEYTVTKDHPLRVRYRFWIQDGETKPQQIARLADDFVQPVKVTVKPLD